MLEMDSALGHLQQFGRQAVGLEKLAVSALCSYSYHSEGRQYRRNKRRACGLPPNDNGGKIYVDITHETNIDELLKPQEFVTGYLRNIFSQTMRAFKEQFDLNKMEIYQLLALGLSDTNNRLELKLDDGTVQTISVIGLPCSAATNRKLLVQRKKEKEHNQERKDLSDLTFLRSPYSRYFESRNSAKSKILWR